MKAIAEWLLAAFGVDEALQGDLVEEVAGRSGAWLLWQTAAAIATHLASGVRRHPALALWAIATGWLLTFAWGFLGRPLVPRPNESIHASFMFYQIAGVFVWPVIVGWVVARTHRTHAVAVVLAYVASATGGWLWVYASHYEQLSRISGVFWVKVGIVQLLTVAGGFLTKPRRYEGGVS